MNRTLFLSLAFFAAVLGRNVRAVEDPGKAWNVDRIDGTIAEWQPTKAERAFDQIGWTSNLLEALRLAKEHGRPILLFTYDGADLACFRC